MVASPLNSPEKSEDGAEIPDEAGAATEEQGDLCVGVRYGAMSWIGEFRLPSNVTISPSANVVIQSDRGIELGEQVGLTRPDSRVGVRRDQIQEYVANSGTEFYRLNAGKVLREASPQDVDEHERLNRHIRQDVDRCAEAAARLGLKLRVITAEHVLGGERIVFYFRSDGRVDFRELVRELAHHYQTRIEMRQVGARDEARLMADYEVCGRLCCCKGFLKKLRPVTMKMAKLQKSTLDPSKVSGRCGRLRCCLRYEHDGYDELLHRLPRIGTRLQTPFGPATVIDRQALTQLLLVRTEDERELTIPAEEVSPFDATATATPEPRFVAEESIEESTDEVSAEPPAESRSETRRRGRRPRGQRQSARESTDTTPEDEAAALPEQEAAPEGPEADRGDQPPEQADERPAEEAPSPRRRRRRRRRPRHRRPDSSAESGEG
jgi:cell fate regulator YaaT (PSP1 superfamily)